ncbi:hypothetical protein [Mangrovibacterium lignilyticum]|uniref:hypothetical protein n=1 Tax=Mangrovibacterium lignilyticum TaxID=2668052 RepID=UPI0013D07210|nr:hypothetical protein [Mangrovibacterium lignilyticum]
MKKLLFSLCMLAFVAVTSTAFGQGDGTFGDPKIEIVNAKRVYSVTANASNSFTWAVYSWTSGVDFTSDTWTATAAPGSAYAMTPTANSTEIEWLVPGSYVVEVTEANGGSGGCTTVRRFGVTIIDLDLLVVTKDNLGTVLTADASAICNTDEGNIYGVDDADDLNSATGVTPALTTMTMTYEITLYTEKAGTDGSEIGTVLNSAGWKFTIVDNSTIPSSPGNVIWTVSTGDTYTTLGSNVITVGAGVSKVTITAEIQNIAANDGTNYVLDFSIDPATVMIENGGTSSSDYAEGQEPDTYDGTSGSHTNDAYQITVKPIPNTSKISAN